MTLFTKILILGSLLSKNLIEYNKKTHNYLDQNLDNMKKNIVINSYHNLLHSVQKIILCSNLIILQLRKDLKV